MKSFDQFHCLQVFALTIHVPQVLHQLKTSKTAVYIKNCFLHILDMKEMWEYKC